MVVDAAEVVAADAGSSAAAVRVEVERARAVLDAYEPVLAALRPVLHRAGDAVERRHVDALAHLLDLVPETLDLIVPALRNLGDLTPELHQLAERFDTVGQIVEGIPGAGMLKRRGSEDDTSS